MLLQKYIVFFPLNRITNKVNIAAVKALGANATGDVTHPGYLAAPFDCKYEPAVTAADSTAGPSCAQPYTLGSVDCIKFPGLGLARTLYNCVAWRKDVPETLFDLRYFEPLSTTKLVYNETLPQAPSSSHRACMTMQ